MGFTRWGKFFLLFSAGSPLGDRKLGVDVPATFEPLDVGTLCHGPLRQPGIVCSETVRQEGVGLSVATLATMYVVSPRLSFTVLNQAPFRSFKDHPGSMFKLTGDRGAALFTKFQTHVRDAAADSAFEFEEYTVRHYESWVEFARGKRVWKDAQPFLVSGFDATRDFLTIEYFSEGRSETSTLTVRPYSDQPGGLWDTRCPPHSPYKQEGPHVSPLSDERVEQLQLASLKSTDEGIPKEFDQCVFLRYYTMRWREAKSPEVVRTEAGPYELSSADSASGRFPEPTDEESADGANDSSSFHTAVEESDCKQAESADDDPPFPSPTGGGFDDQQTESVDDDPSFLFLTQDGFDDQQTESVDDDPPFSSPTEEDPDSDEFFVYTNTPQV